MSQVISYLTFDTVVAHLRQQKKKARGLNQVGMLICKYRGDDGLKCAAGCLIPDELYKPEMEGMAAYPGPKSNPERMLVRETLEALWHDPSLVSALQYVHDQWDVSCWEEELEAIAEEHNVIYTPPKETADANATGDV